MLQTALVGYCIPRENSAAPENVWSRSRRCHARAGCCALHDTDTHDEESKKMNTPKTAWIAAASAESSVDRGSEQKAAAIAKKGWDPYEVWRTRVLGQTPSAENATPNEQPPRPLLIRAK